MLRKPAQFFHSVLYKKLKSWEAEKLGEVIPSILI